MPRPARTSGLKARDLIARAGGPGNPPTTILKALKARNPQDFEIASCPQSNTRPNRNGVPQNRLINRNRRRGFLSAWEPDRTQLIAWNYEKQTHPRRTGPAA